MPARRQRTETKGPSTVNDAANRANESSPVVVASLTPARCARSSDELLWLVAVDQPEDGPHQDVRHDVGDGDVTEEPVALRDERYEPDGERHDETDPLERAVEDPLDRR